MEDLVSNLLQPTTGEGAKAWASFFLNVDLVRQFSEAVPHDTKKAVGLLWDGTCWNTSKASKKLWDVAGVGLVSGDVNQYDLSGSALPQDETCFSFRRSLYSFVSG